MIRTVISLDPEEKLWLDRTSRREKIPMSRLVRRAVADYRKRMQAGAPSLERLLETTRGLWKSGDAVSRVRRLRSEWRR